VDQGGALAAGTEVTPELLAEVLSASWRRWRRLLAAELGPLGLSPWEARALEVVVAEGPLAMGALARALAIQPRSATSAVRALAQAGLVARQVDHQDRRLVLVVATPAGRRTLAEVHRARRAAAQACFAHLRGPERRQLAGLLARLVELAPPDPGGEPG
jgi:DNA-binding MarR family transcriptional regulator